jgi:hypothetical protein
VSILLIFPKFCFIIVNKFEAKAVLELDDATWASPEI